MGCGAEGEVADEEGEDAAAGEEVGEGGFEEGGCEEGWGVGVEVGEVEGHDWSRLV